MGTEVGLSFVGHSKADRGTMQCYLRTDRVQLVMKIHFLLWLKICSPEIQGDLEKNRKIQISKKKGGKTNNILLQFINTSSCPALGR